MGKNIKISGKDLVELSMAFAEEVVPEALRPADVRACLMPEQSRSVNFDCFRILAAAAFESGWKFSCGRPLAAPTEITCAAIDYTLSHNLGCKQKRLDFFRHCFREGATCQKRATVERVQTH